LFYTVWIFLYKGTVQDQTRNRVEVKNVSLLEKQNK
jgi:hypothetical protein